MLIHEEAESGIIVADDAQAGLNSRAEGNFLGDGGGVERQDHRIDAADGGINGREAVVPKRTIIFQTYLGIRWEFPFDECKSLKGLSNLVKRTVHPHSEVPECYLEVVQDLEAMVDEFTIVHLNYPTNSLILPEHWEYTIEPGWEIAIQAKGISLMKSWMYGQPAEELMPDRREELVTDISYIVNFYDKGISGEYSNLIATKRYDNPVSAKLSRKMEKYESILEVVSKVYRSNKLPLANSDVSEIQTGDILYPPVLFVRSKVLLNALKAVVEFQSLSATAIPTPGMDYRVDGTSGATNLDEGVFRYPFQDLFHYKNDLLDYKSRVDLEKRHTAEYNQTCKDHIDVLVNFLYAQEGINLKEVESLFESGKTTFNCYWLLLKPGTNVYVRDDRDQLNGYVLETVSGGPCVLSDEQWAQAYELLVWNLEFDGERLGRSTKTISIPVFSGEREIEKLAAFPAHMHRIKDGEESIEKSLTRRGRAYIDVVRAPTFQQYTGMSNLQSVRMYDQARVIVDHTNQPWKLPSIKEMGGHQPCYEEPSELSTMQLPPYAYYGRPRPETGYRLGSKTRVPECECQACTTDGIAPDRVRRRAFDDYENIILHSQESLSDHQYFLCWSRVYAFILKDRLWDLLDVSKLSPPRINRNIIDTLVMKHDGNKAMVKAICETYGVDQAHNLYFADSIRGKGEGQILLLHGPPGTGKTLTAESVAEYTGRPLLSITAADLGHEPIELEKRLLRFFRDANKWNAIVLLDEADVYLERRSMQDLQRNSIVSVFLRALDYFQGILFLTTNRVGSVDEAFLSRIHVQIGYDKLDDESRFQIWKNHFKKLDRNHEFGGPRIEYAANAEAYVQTSQDVRDLQWNGREIRNAVQTAVTLASFKARQEGRPVPVITKDHIAEVVQMSRNFKDYMKATLQADDSEFAYQRHLRDDRTKTAGRPLV